jgi:hypothetical protein
MKPVTRQEGMSIWGVFGLALIGIFFLLLMFKLIPPYIDDLKVGSAIERVAQRPGAGTMTADELINSIDKMFDVENISHVSAGKDVEIVPRGDNVKIIKLHNEREIPLTANISILMYFDHSVEAR